MRRKRQIGLGLLAAAVVAAACGDEGPTEVGSGLVGTGLQTVHVTLDAPAFLERDTTFGRIGTLNEVVFGVVANDFEGELDARLLFQVVQPGEVEYQSSTNAQVTDSIAAYLGGTVTVVLDSASLPDGGGPIDLALVQVVEQWDPASASWTERVDTGDVSIPWATAGGTTGPVMGTGTWTAGDTVLIPVDSASVALWNDSTALDSGGAIEVTTPGARLRVRSVDISFDVVPANNDTVVSAGVAGAALSLASPDTDPPPTVLRVGGTPAWRSLVKFRSIPDIMVPCRQGSTSCQVPLSSATVNTANLILKTRPAGGRRVERPSRFQGRAVLQGPSVHVTRSPMSAPFGRMRNSVTAAAFTAPAGMDVTVPITGFLRENLDLPEGQAPVPWLALTIEGERTLFGYGHFGALNSATPPQLELVVTIPDREVTP